MLIGALAELTGVATKTLRYWEEEGLLQEPQRTRSRYRDYSMEAVDRVMFIRHAQAADLTLRQIGEIIAIRADGQAPCAHTADLVSERLSEVEQRLRDLNATRAALLRLRNGLAELDPADCDPKAVCSAIASPDP